MAKKDKKGAAPGGDEAPAATSAGPWTCAECEQENEAGDAVCCACEEPRPVAAQPSSSDPYSGFVVGLIVSAEKVAGKDKLSVVKVDVGGDEPLQVVTNAPNAVEGARVVVAMVGSKVKGESGEGEEVKKGPVGGAMSHGMLCNAPMLGWKGGDNKAAATLPGDAFAVGSRPPESRPRGG
ncbi:hypothetical protein FOA52_000578 [Chlamydomonas sp. UWO 241]|nr:hypothetical protein FOA52_000578 [Chlamydomonas sp. UWO 241]